MEIAHCKKQKIKLYISPVNLKRICVLFTGLLPFICYIMLLVKGISLIAYGKVGLAYVNTEETGLAVRLYAGTDSMLTDTRRTGYVHSDYIKFYNDIAPTG